MQILINNVGTLDDASIVEESMTLQESICSESQLRFGCCEASVFKIRLIAQSLPIVEKDIIVSIPYEGQAFQLGKYKVLSDKPTADRKYRDIVAYDAMYDILNSDVAEWYNTILPNTDSIVTLKDFRDSFFSHFGVEQEAVELVNDSMIVTKTIEPSKLSGKTVVTAICEINGCFGHIGRNGKLQYVFLKEMVDGLYPFDTLYPSDDLFPRDAANIEAINKSNYISAKYEDFITEKITKLQIRQEEDDIGCIYGTGDNCYIVQDNFLVYGKDSNELQIIASNLYSVIHTVIYRPAQVEAKGNPCLEVGDGIRLVTTNEIIRTYILQRTLKGIQALRDTYDAEGEQYQTEDVNSVHEDIIQLKGKTNKLTRTIEETKSEIVDIERNLSSQILQNAEQILLKVSKDNIISEINQTAEQITISAQKIDLNGLVTADEFVSKYATLELVHITTANIEFLLTQKASVEQLDAINATVQKLSVEKLDASEFTAEKISAKGITVDAANIIGTLSANKISAGSVTVNGTTINSNWTAKEVVVGISEKTTSNGYMTDIKLKTEWIYFLGA